MLVRRCIIQETQIRNANTLSSNDNVKSQTIIKSEIRGKELCAFRRVADLHILKHVVEIEKCYISAILV